MTAKMNPKYVTFDCYGTLIDDDLEPVTKRALGPLLRPEIETAFFESFWAYRFDEVSGPWQPFRDVLANALRRASKRFGLPFNPDHADQIYNEIPSWGPHPDVPAGLKALEGRVPLVILSNAINSVIEKNVESLGVRFDAVLTAEDAHAYKPRLAAFEYMLDQLGCGPEEILHVSASLRYDLMPAWGMGIRNKVYVNRGYEPSTPYYEYHEITKLTELPGILGI